MDRKNGGDPLAPPRPPKLLPRVHRPRAPEPPMMSAPLTPATVHQQPQPQQQQSPQLCTNNHIHQIRSINNTNNNNNLSISPTPLISLHNINSNNNNNTLSRNNSNLSSTTITSANSFTRRRPPPPSPILTANLAPTVPIFHSTELPGSPVTLAAPRPENERLANEYVDTPFRAPTTVQQLQNASRNQHPAGQTIHGQTTTQHNLLLQHSQRQQQHHSSHNQSSNINNNAISGGPAAQQFCLDAIHQHHPHHPASTLHSNIHSPKDISNSLSTASATTTTASTPNSRIQQTNRTANVLPITQPITKQPSSFTKDVLPSPASTIYNEETSSIADSPSLITCPQCKRCRCEECQKPRPLPSTWICNKTCLCSAETVIDYASCLCCVKALFYHCSRDHEMRCDDGESISCADFPCSCLPHRRTARWGWLGALSLVLPCLWCYWPMRACTAVCAKCYGRNAREGCRCENIGSTSSMLPIAPIGSGSTLGTKSSGVSGGVHSGISGSGNHHHNHHSAGSRIIRKCDLTPEKRLLDSSPEY